MYLNDHLRRFYDNDVTVFEPRKYSLQDLFPLPNDGIIKLNKYYNNDAIPRYMCTQISMVVDALTCHFKGGVYFLWDDRRKILKIGCSKNLEKRVAKLINDAKIYALNDDLRLIGIHPTAFTLISKLEKRYHELFKEYKYKYEWFDVSLSECQDLIGTSSNGFSTFINTYFLDFWLIYSEIDLVHDELDTILEMWPYSREQAQKTCPFDELISDKITILVQNNRGDIIPFGWMQDDIDYLNSQNIWDNQNIICFQKLRILSWNDNRTLQNFAFDIT